MKFATIATVLLTLSAGAAAQAPVLPPPLPAEQERQLAAMPQDTQVYERFRSWAGVQPPDVQDKWEIYYDAYLQRLGVAQNERARLIRIINLEGQRLEVDRWNRILTADKPLFNTNPNAFLVDVIRGRTPGAALDVGMGQDERGLPRNKDGGDRIRPAGKSRQATPRTKAGSSAPSTDDAGFDFGQTGGSPVELRGRPRVRGSRRAVQARGLVVVEGLHRDVTKASPVGGAVVFDTNELP
jgi:hypothetical protein